MPHRLYTRCAGSQETNLIKRTTSHSSRGIEPDKCQLMKTRSQLQLKFHYWQKVQATGQN